MDFKINIISLFVVIMIIGFFINQCTNVVASESMEPVFYRGDIVIVDSNYKDIHVGDIVVYSATWTPQPENIIHRVIKEQKLNGTTIYITQGDNNKAPDPEMIHPNQIRFKVVSINNHELKIPKLGYITLTIRGS